MLDIKEANWLLGMMISGDIGPLTFYTSQRQRHVIFDKKPPLNPGSQMQIRQRNIFRTIAKAWHGLTPEAQAKWELATKRLSARMNGYHLYVWWHTKQDLTALRTVERLTHLKLLT